MRRLEIAGRWIGEGEPTYFIADIGANHDGSLDRAKNLIYLAKQAGADAAKFQHFKAPRIVSDYGFKSLGRQASHQAGWKKSVYQVYEAASLPREWTQELKEYCDSVGIHFFSSPYDMEAVSMLDPLVPAFKIGSGDITWLEILKEIARKGKPTILATGASALEDVTRAVDTITALNPALILLQCNTNYTGAAENFRFVNLKVLGTYGRLYPDLSLGLSDHTPGHAAVLGAVALGARVVEKHFTDDTSREGPDHAFAMDPPAWRDMTERTRELEMAFGDGKKVVEPNEQETVVLQRRCIRAGRDLPAGTILSLDGLDVLRPAPADSIAPYDMARVVGRRVRGSLAGGEHLTWEKIE